MSTSARLTSRVALTRLYRQEMSAGRRLCMKSGRNAKETLESVTKGGYFSLHIKAERHAIDRKPDSHSDTGQSKRHVFHAQGISRPGQSRGGPHRTAPPGEARYDPPADSRTLRFPQATSDHRLLFPKPRRDRQGPVRTRRLATPAFRRLRREPAGVVRTSSGPNRLPHRRPGSTGQNRPSGDHGERTGRTPPSPARSSKSAGRSSTTHAPPRSTKRSDPRSNRRFRMPLARRGTAPPTSPSSSTSRGSPATLQKNPRKDRSEA